MVDYVKLMSEVYAPDDIKNEAILCFEKTEKIYKDQIRPYAYKAPFAVARIVQSLPWDAESLRESRFPEWWGKYDNNISVNGDLAAWTIKPETGTEYKLPCPLEDNEEARSYCYYAKGHHPRSKWARWIWMGIRNRASRLSNDFGIIPGDIVYWGDADIGRHKEGVCLFKMGDGYQFLEFKKFGPFVRRRTFGYKIQNTLKFKERASLVHITFDITKWKGE